MNFAGCVLVNGKVTKIVQHSHQQAVKEMKRNGKQENKITYKSHNTLMLSLTGFIGLRFIWDFRWTHYLKQYALHKKSLLLEKELDDKFKGNMQSYLDMGISWNDVSSFTN